MNVWFWLTTLKKDRQWSKTIVLFRFTRSTFIKVYLIKAGRTRTVQETVRLPQIINFFLMKFILLVRRGLSLSEALPWGYPKVLRTSWESFDLYLLFRKHGGSSLTNVWNCFRPENNRVSAPCRKCVRILVVSSLKYVMEMRQEPRNLFENAY